MQGSILCVCRMVFCVIVLIWHFGDWLNWQSMDKDSHLLGSGNDMWNVEAFNRALKPK